MENTKRQTSKGSGTNAASTRPINYSALTEHRVILRIWFGVIFAGLFMFFALLVLSYFMLNAPSIVHDTIRYRRWEGTLGIGELGGIGVAVAALLRYKTVKNKYNVQVFNQLVADNGWNKQKKFGIEKVASILLGTGESYEQGFGFEGSYNGQSFSCLIFEYLEQDSDTKRYICLSFKLPKSYPMIIIDNKLNDHRYWRHDSNLPDRIPSGVRVKLEGDFDNYFRISTTRGNEQETLEVLTPEFMAALEDTAANKVDIEISNKNLFLIYEADNYSKHNLMSLFTMADVVNAKLHRLSRTWMASSKSAEGAMADTADAARHKLIFRSDIVSFIVFLLTFVAFVVLMISHIKDEPPCTPTTPCYQSGGVYTGP